MPKQYGSADSYEKKLERVIERLGADSPDGRIRAARGRRLTWQRSLGCKCMSIRSCEKSR